VAAVQAHANDLLRQYHNSNHFRHDSLAPVLPSTSPHQTAEAVMLAAYIQPVSELLADELEEGSIDAFLVALGHMG
jgi:hypothetical protein